jgi:hypothetical protein
MVKDFIPPSSDILSMLYDAAGEILEPEHGSSATNAMKKKFKDMMDGVMDTVDRSDDLSADQISFLLSWRLRVVADIRVSTDLVVFESGKKIVPWQKVPWHKFTTEAKNQIGGVVFGTPEAMQQAQKGQNVRVIARFVRSSLASKGFIDE